MKYLIATAAAAAMFACAGSGRKAGDAARDSDKQPDATTSHGDYRQFALPPIPAAVPPEQQRPWMQEHFWDGFRFADSAYVAAQDSDIMVRLFALYAVQVVDPRDPTPLGNLMRRAEAHGHTLRYFLSLAERVLHDPNSPLRNDELYIPVLEAATASPRLSPAEKIAPQHDLRMARQNRIGHTANDFTFTDIDGRNSSLHGIRSPFVLLFFSNPDCPLCARIAGELQTSAVITRAVAARRLQIVMLYPDDDLAAWRRHAREIPASWSYARDGGHEIRDGELYDLKAIPALYLLDSLKRVVVKDASAIGHVERALASSGV